MTDIKVGAGTVVEFAHGIRVGQYESEDDGAHLIWIDTEEGTGHIRVNLNDALHPLYDGDCERDDDRMTAFRKEFERLIVDTIDLADDSTESDSFDDVINARDEATDLLSIMLVRLKELT